MGATTLRNLVITLAATLAISGCATAPTVTHDGNLAVLKGKSLAALSGQSSPTDAALAKSIETGVLKRLAANGVDVAGGKPPAYLLQVGVGVSAPGVGISNVAGPSVKQTAWRSAPTKRHWWQRQGQAHTATAVVLDVATGKPAAWASVRADRGDPEQMAEQLAQALAGPAS
jgi:hypothetical protein